MERENELGLLQRVRGNAIHNSKQLRFGETESLSKAECLVGVSFSTWLHVHMCVHGCVTFTHSFIESVSAEHLVHIGPWGIES